MADQIKNMKNQIYSQTEEQEEVEELDISDTKTSQLPQEIAQLIAQYKKLHSLGMTNCGLTTLDGFPSIPSLNVLILEANFLSGESIQLIPQLFPNLYCLSLADNQIKKLEEVSVLSQLVKLKQLDLSDNGVSALPNYSKDVFEIIPTLEVLDNRDKNGKDIQYSDESFEQYSSGGSQESEESEEESPIKKIKR